VKRDLETDTRARNKVMKKIVAIVLTVSCLISGQAFADDDREQDQALKLRQQGAILPLEEILKAAKKIHQGRVVEVELQKEHGTYIYELEIVDTSGQVWEMKLDAKDATVLSSERED